MNTRCPNCGVTLALETLVNDEAGREVMARLASLPDSVTRPLVGYLSMFRSSQRSLSWTRAHKLIEDTLALGDPALLAVALQRAVDHLRDKQASASWSPMKNHNYLKRVLENVSEQDLQQPSPVTGEPRRPATSGSRHAQAIAALDE